MIFVPVTTPVTRLKPPASSNRVRSPLPMAVAATVAAVLVPWCVVLAFTLPATTTAAHWSLAWVGLDAAEASSAALTWWFIRRCSAYAAVTSAMGAALLLADAWFDVCTSAAGMAQRVAVLQAAVLEIPLACAALWVRRDDDSWALAAPLWSRGRCQTNRAPQLDGHLWVRVIHRSMIAKDARSGHRGRARSCR